VKFKDSKWAKPAEKGQASYDGNVTENMKARALALLLMAAVLAAIGRRHHHRTGRRQQRLGGQGAQLSTALRSLR
jgi:hypothetical protein